MFQIPLFIQRFNNRFILVTPRLVLKKPLFLIRALYRSVYQKYKYTDKLRSILFHTHYKCNLTCSHCYETSFNNTDQELLTLEEKTMLLRQAVDELGVLSVDFVGGETSLDKNLPELVKACRPRRTYITLATNGYGFTEKRIRNLMKIGIDKLNISMDSWYEEEHDEVRQKKGAYKQAWNTVKLCRKVGMQIHLTIFVYKNSTKSAGFKKMVAYAVENKIRLAAKPAIPLGEIEADHDMLITNEDKEEIDRLYRTYPFIKTCDKGNRKGGCPAFDEIFTLNAYGEVMPCNAIHVSFGNVRQDSLKSIIQRGRQVRIFNGCNVGCPPSDDRDFIKKYLSKTYNAVPYPVRHEEVFDRSDPYSLMSYRALPSPTGGLCATKDAPPC